MKTMRYRGYTGSVEMSETDGVYFGKVLGIRSLVSYEGTDPAALEEDFRGAVEDYLAENEEPRRMFRPAEESSLRAAAH